MVVRAVDDDHAVARTESLRRWCAATIPPTPPPRMTMVEGPDGRLRPAPTSVGSGSSGAVVSFAPRQTTSRPSGRKRSKTRRTTGASCVQPCQRPFQKTRSTPWVPCTGKPSSARARAVPAEMLLPDSSRTLIASLRFSRWCREAVSRGHLATPAPPCALGARHHGETSPRPGARTVGRSLKLRRELLPCRTLANALV